jgi:hypothetical protein
MARHIMKKRGLQDPLLRETAEDLVIPTVSMIVTSVHTSYVVLGYSINVHISSY